MDLNFKEILGDEIVKKLDEVEITSKVLGKLETAKLIKDDGNYVRKDSGDYIPREKFNEERNKLRQQLEQRDKDVEDLEKKIKEGGNAAEMLNEMKDKHKEETAKLEKRVKDTEVEHAVEMALIKAQVAKTSYVDLLKPQVMKHSDKFIRMDDGKYTGIDDIIKGLKENDDYKSLFGEIKPAGTPPGDGGGKNGDLTYEGKKASELTLTDKLVLKKLDSTKYLKMFPEG